MTQHQRIIEKWRDCQWHCVSEFHSITWYPWKRRAEIEKKGQWRFEPRKCEHGIEGGQDWRMYPARMPTINEGSESQLFTYKVHYPVTNFHDPQ